MQVVVAGKRLPEVEGRSRSQRSDVSRHAQSGLGVSAKAVSFGQKEVGLVRCSEGMLGMLTVVVGVYSGRVGVLVRVVVLKV